MRFEGKVALITGASRGIGVAIAHTLAREGAAVVLADIDAQGIEQAAEEIKGRGQTAIAGKVDVGSFSDVQTLVDEALEQFDAVLEIEKRNPLAILHKAEINYELENWEEALKLAKLALARDPGLASAMEWVKDAVKKAGLMDEDGNIIGTLEEEPEGKP